MRNMSFGRSLAAVSGVVMCGALLIGSRSANAAGTLSLSTTSVNVGTSQLININISGSDQVAGTTVYVQVNDGGTANGGTSTKPTITNLDATTGIFSTNNSGNTFTPDGSLIASALTTLNSGTVPDNGTLATLTLNTTGLSPGNTFTIQFANVAGSHNTIVNDGSDTPIALSGTGFTSPATITVVPEPMAASLLLVGIGGLALRRSRR